MHPVLESFAREYGAGSAWFLTFFIIFLRYVLPAGLVYLLVYGWKRRDWLFWKIQQKFPNAQRIKSEISHSAMACAIFASMAFGVYALRQMGYGPLYFDIAERGWGYFFFTIALMIVAHDTYFYWTHRLMHHPRLFKVFHLVHHQSTNPTPFTAFSFHPLESIVEFGIIPIIALLIPIHTGALLVFTAWSMVFNIMGHTGYEFSPSGFTRHWFFKWFNTPTHHNMHHHRSGYNYSLYFNFWDRVMGTNHPEYDAYFENIKARTQQQLDIDQGKPYTHQKVSKAGITTIFLLCSSITFAQIGIEEIKNGQYGTPETRALQADNMMKKGLGLTPEQSIPVHDINLRYAWRTENEVVKANLSDWAKYRKIMALQKEKDLELKKILTQAQFDQYENKRDELFWSAVKDYFFG
jgi:lathosterol oxidase